jgi:hypothetical protein
MDYIRLYGQIKPKEKFEITWYGFDVHLFVKHTVMINE